MKVNPVGIQTYQHVNRQPKPPVAPEQEALKAPEQKVVVEPQSAEEKTALAVKAPRGDYSQFLSSEEKQALDLLFDKFRDASRFGNEYGKDSRKTGDGQTLGQVIDVKV